MSAESYALAESHWPGEWYERAIECSEKRTYFTGRLVKSGPTGSYNQRPFPAELRFCIHTKCWLGDHSLPAGWLLVVFFPKEAAL